LAQLMISGCSSTSDITFRSSDRIRNSVSNRPRLHSASSRTGSVGTSGSANTAVRLAAVNASSISASFDPNWRNSVISLTPACCAMRRVVAPRYPASAYTWAAAPSSRSRMSIRAQAYPALTSKASNHLHTLLPAFRPARAGRPTTPHTKKEPGLRRARSHRPRLSMFVLGTQRRRSPSWLRLDRVLEVVEEPPRPANQWDGEEKPPSHRAIERHAREIHRVRQLRVVVRDEQKHEQRR